MEKLKLTSVRLSKGTLDSASKLSNAENYLCTSDILRIAIWLGLKLLRPGVLLQLQHMMAQEETGWKSYTLEEVLRILGYEL